MNGQRIRRLTESLKVLGRGVITQNLPRAHTTKVAGSSSNSRLPPIARARPLLAARFQPGSFYGRRQFRRRSSSGCTLQHERNLSGDAPRASGDAPCPGAGGRSVSAMQGMRRRGALPAAQAGQSTGANAGKRVRKREPGADSEPDEAYPKVRRMMVCSIKKWLR